jgi:nitrite reductase/ring-hydroxylating ferredoxin subunit/multimeric flavodoxin WrbA
MNSKCEKIWRCKVCGYEHRGEAPPECCPSCGAPASEFEEVGECKTSDEVWHDVGAADELKAQPLREIEIPNAKIALVYKDGVFKAISGSCNHVGGPLGLGRMDGDYVVCPWHQWRFHASTGEGKSGCACEGGKVPCYAVKVEKGRVFINPTALTERVRKPVAPHTLTRVVVRGQPGGPSEKDPVRIVGISTTNMDINNPRYSTSDYLLNIALTRARECGAETRLIRLAELKFRACEGYYSQSERACTWPCSITQMDPTDQMERVYEAFTQWGDIFVVATPIRWGQAGSLYYKMVERMNCIQNQETIADRHLLRKKVVGLIITGGQDNIQSVAGQMLSFFSELGCQFPQYPFIAHSRGWSAEDMENNTRYVKESKDLAEAATGLVDRCIDTYRALLDIDIGSAIPPRGGRKAHELDVHSQI